MNNLDSSGNNMDNEPRSSQNIFFDPELHPEDTLKAFNEFTQIFELRYNAKFPDPPKVSLDAAIERWKVAQRSEATPEPKPDLAQYDTIRDEWRSKDKVAKLLGMFSSNRLYMGWCVAEPSEDLQQTSKWDEFITKMTTFYKPTENITLKHFHLRAVNQNEGETFTSFCNRVQKEAKHCDFKCTNAGCTAESVAVRGQIIIGTKENYIRREALKLSWDLLTLMLEGMKLESAAKGGAELDTEATVNKLGKYSF